MQLVVLTGASGSGKTTIAKAIAKTFADVDVKFFDDIGVPPVEQMIADHGSGEAWQRAATIDWMARLAALRARPVLFEGQMRLAFVVEAAEAAGIAQYRLILVDCDDAARVRRLARDRNQPELANPTMLSWARFLRDEAQTGGYEIMDTTTIPLDACVRRIASYLGSDPSRSLGGERPQ